MTKATYISKGLSVPEGEESIYLMVGSIGWAGRCGTGATAELTCRSIDRKQRALGDGWRLFKPQNPPKVTHLL